MKGKLAAIALLAVAGPAQAVVITEAAWRAHGGTDQAWDQGFSAHEARAAEPQFRAMVALTINDREYGVASGVWLGNHDGHAFVLTAGHVFDGEGKASDYRARTIGGAVLTGVSAVVHPLYDQNDSATGGFDFAILELNAPITDAGDPPILYRGATNWAARA